MNIETGKLYMATLDGVPDQIVMTSDYEGVVCAIPVRGFLNHPVRAVTDARPLVVLDLGGDDLDTWISMRRDLCAALRSSADECFPKSPYPHDLLSLVADQVEAQSMRIEEPGMYGVVKSAGHDRVRIPSQSPLLADWVGDNGVRLRWDELTDPILVRDGIAQ